MKPPPRKKPTTQKTVTIIAKNETKESAVDEPVSSQKVSTFSQETKTEKAINGTESMGKDDTQQAKVDVPQHVIYMLLIGESHFCLKVQNLYLKCPNWTNIWTLNSV